MSHAFQDVAAIRARAKSSLKTQTGMVQRWFVNKYKLPVTHETYGARSEPEWLEEMYVDLYVEQEQAMFNLKELDQTQMAAKAQEAERRRLTAELQRLAQVLDEAPPTIITDTVLDDMDAAVARGDQVDLNSLLPKGWKPPPDT